MFTCQQVFINGALFFLIITFVGMFFCPFSHSALCFSNIRRTTTRTNELINYYWQQVSLFTNVPLRKTVHIIPNRVYYQKLINTSLSERSLKKLILDTCQKTALSFNNILYEQIDAVSMGESLGSVLANIIMT